MEMNHDHKLPNLYGTAIGIMDRIECRNDADVISELIPRLRAVIDEMYTEAISRIPADQYPDPVTEARIALKNIGSLASPGIEAVISEKVEKAFQYIKKGGKV